MKELSTHHHVDIAVKAARAALSNVITMNMNHQRDSSNWLPVYTSRFLSPCPSFLWPILFVVLLLASCQKDPDNSGTGDSLAAPADYSYEVPYAWNSLMLELERYLPAPIAARNSGYIGLAAYEAVQPGMRDEYNSVAAQFPGLVLPQAGEGPYHWPTVLAACYAKSCELFYRTAPSALLFNIYSLRNSQFIEYKQIIDPAVFDRSSNYGAQVAQAVHNWAATDSEAHNAWRRPRNPSYVPAQGLVDGIWRPTFPDYGAPVLPAWGNTRTFVADDTDTCEPPPPYSDQPASEMYQQHLTIVQKVDSIKQGYSSEDAWIAIFWSDDCATLTFTPSGRWIAIANQLLQQEDSSLPEALELYAKVGISLCDAGIRTWHEKYKWNTERPIDYIRRVMDQTTWNTIMCPDGTGKFFTPPFPAYPSGHAAFGAAAVEVMVDFVGDNYHLVDRCHENRTEFDGRPRAFNSFYAMAEENAYSRIPLGVHIQADLDAGLTLGYQIGNKVNQLPWRR